MNENLEKIENKHVMNENLGKGENEHVVNGREELNENLGEGELLNQNGHVVHDVVDEVDVADLDE